MWIALLLACGPVACAVEEETPAGTGCLADSLGTLRNFAGFPDCHASLEACRQSCDAGSANDCVGAAYALQRRDDRAGANALFERGCAFGSANACTNYGASIWVRSPPKDELSCARRIFAASCAAGEHFACGMIGRIAFSQADSPADYEAVRADLEASCSQVGGFACRVLAKQLETRKLGDPSGHRVSELLARACEGGDREACGNPDSASETFD